MNLSKIILINMTLVEKYLYDGIKKKDAVLKMVRNEIGDKTYDELERVVIDILEMLIQISKKRIKLELNNKGYFNCLP